MYYSGIPFNEFSKIDSISTRERYFHKSSEILPFSDAAYEGILQNKVDIVIYQEAVWNDEKLIKYHKSKYGNVLFYTENKIADNVYKITSVLDGKITKYQIFKYDKLWRVEVEQNFDENHLLSEYRKMTYNDELRRIPNSEKIFFSSWHISEENYS
jgi:hypothetical protein